MSHKLTTCFLAMLLTLGPAFPGIQWVIFGASMAVCAVICVMVFPAGEASLPEMAQICVLTGEVPMKIVFVSNYYNHHQAPLCQALDALNPGQFHFVATSEMRQERRQMGYTMTDVPAFVRCAHKDPEERAFCLRLIREADVVIAGAAPEKLIAPRIHAGKLTFRYTERLFKRVPKPLELLKRWISQHLRNPRKKPVYLLCAGAYTAADYAKLGLFSGKAYRWGYFPAVSYEYAGNKSRGSILWAGRLLDWKHPDDALEAVRRLIDEGYDINLEIVGAGELAPQLEEMVRKSGLENRVSLAGVRNPGEVRALMERSEIFLFTSDRQEGWGAVLNEAMSSGCAVVASHAAGSVPFLVEDGKNGLIYPSGDVDMLSQKLRRLLDHPEICAEIGMEAQRTVAETWNAETAARRLCTLAEHILSGEEFPEIRNNGPCSRAEILCDGWM